MTKAKPIDTSDAKAGGAKAPPADARGLLPETGAAPIVVTAARTLNRYLPPGTIIPHPTERELALCREGAAEPLADWWPGLAQDESVLADGKRYPVLLTRSGGELWVRLDARTLRPLNDCSQNEAIAAIGRTSDTAALEQAAQHARQASVRQAAKSIGARVGSAETVKADPTPGGTVSPTEDEEKARLEVGATIAEASTTVRPTGEAEPVAIGFSGGRWPAVVLDNGKEVKPATLYLGTLLPLIAGSEHVTLLQTLAKTDKRPEVAAAVQARLAQLAAPPPAGGEVDPKAGETLAPPDADPPGVEDPPETKTTGTAAGPTEEPK